MTSQYREYTLYSNVIQKANYLHFIDHIIRLQSPFIHVLELNVQNFTLKKSERCQNFERYCECHTLLAQTNMTQVENLC